MCDKPTRRTVHIGDDVHVIDADAHAVHDGYLYLSKAGANVATFAPGRWTGVTVG